MPWEYNQWFNRTIAEANQIKEPLKQIQFLVNEKDWFIRNNPDDEEIKTRFEGIIEQKRFEFTQGIPKGKEKKDPPPSFEELFKDPDQIQDCIEVLKKVEPPVLNDNEEFIGNTKGVFCLWVDKLERRGLINHFSDRSVYAKAISSRFAPFSIDESMFGKSHKRAEDKYSKELDVLLSQVSQKVNQGR